MMHMTKPSRLTRYLVPICSWHLPSLISDNTRPDLFQEKCIFFAPDCALMMRFGAQSQETLPRSIPGGRSSAKCRRRWLFSVAESILEGSAAQPLRSSLDKSLIQHVKASHLPSGRLNCQQFHFKRENRIGRDNPSCTSFTVGHLGRNNQLALSTHFHTHNPFIPAFNHIPLT